MQNLHKHFTTRRTPQDEPLTDDQVEMRSGGYGWAVNRWARLDRFLVLGCEGGTYYVKERALSCDAAQASLSCIKEDGARAVARIAQISEAGRAAKNDPALFALAMAAKLGDESTRAAAYRALPRVARIGTHLFHFAEYAKALGGLGGNGCKRAIARWYLSKEPARLAYQAVKYQQRDGWTHRDLLRLAHPRADSAAHQAVLGWVVKGWVGELGEVDGVDQAMRLVWAFERARCTTSVNEMVRLISDHGLPHECVPTEMKRHARVWEALLERMPVGAMIRNLNKMTAVGLLTNTSAATTKIRETLADLERLRRARLHPMAVLVALRTYAGGRGMRGRLSWSPVARVVDALDGAFYLAFGAVEPAGKRVCLALDVSGSMCARVSGAPALSCREASAAMALVTAAVEPSHELVAFTSGSVSRRGRKDVVGPSVSFDARGYGGITPLRISPRQRLDDVLALTTGLPFGGTDCALPMRWAQKRKLPVDAFVIYTDNESWAGEVHVDQALNDYRQAMGIPARLVAVAMSADRYSVANPADAGQMDVVGFDTAAPRIIRDFLAGGASLKPEL